MTVTNFYLAIIIGTLISLLVDELFGIQCGGLIVPGYLAMVIDDIPCILLVFAKRGRAAQQQASEKFRAAASLQICACRTES